MAVFKELVMDQFWISGALLTFGVMLGAKEFRGSSAWQCLVWSVVCLLAWPLVFGAFVTEHAFKLYKEKQ